MDSTNSREEWRAAPDKSAVADLRAKPKRKRDRAATQQALLQAATKLFAHRGFEATTTREIAACAGCSEGLIHRYFNSKAGLLFALIQSRVSQEIEDLNERLPLAPTLEEAFPQLVDWEVERMWEDRDFLRVILPRAFLDPARGRLLRGRLLKRLGASRHVSAILERLKRFKRCQSLPAEEIEGLAEFIGVLGFAYGFMHPVVLRRDRGHARKMAATVAKIFIRGV
jgi:AcrR family transcriptional regulator